MEDSLVKSPLTIRSAPSRLLADAGTSMIASSAPPPPTLDGLEFPNPGKPLGEGVFGQIYLANAKAKPYAVKRISKESLSDLDSALAVMHEVNVQKQLQHPSILKLHTWKQDGEYLYLVLDYMPNGDLEARVGKKLTPQFVARIIKSCASGLSHLRIHDIIHRDVKPPNTLLVDDAGNAKIADFGLAVKSSGPQFVVTGTAPYMAPEMLENDYSEDPTKRRGYGVEVDMWALGIMSFRLLDKTYNFPYLAPGKHARGIYDENKLRKQIFEEINSTKTLGGFTDRILQEKKLPEGQVGLQDWKDWEGILSLISELLQIDPCQRMKPEGVLAHEWIKTNTQEHKPSGSWFARFLPSVESFSSGLWTGESKEEQFEECADLSFHTITGLPQKVFEFKEPTQSSEPSEHPGEAVGDNATMLGERV